MVTRERERAPADRRLERAVEHVNNFWFPVNRELLETLRAAVQDGKYNSDCNGLVREIRGDFALFTYCLREVAAMLKEEGRAVDVPRQPCELLEWAGTERLKTVLAREHNAISPHSLHNISETQRLRLEEAVISASASQAFFSGLGLNPDLAYSAAMLRQLGYALVAWNYSSAYQKALFSLRPGESLDMAITTLLGFSPTLLAIRIMGEWGISPELLSVVKGEDLPGRAIEEGELESAAVVKTLSRICRIGEALARANNPHYYPSASKDWNFAFDEVEAILGRDGLAIISSKVEENARAYVSHLPHIFKGGFIFDPESRLRPETGVATYEPNPFVDLCGDPLKADLRALYMSMGTGKPAQEYIRTLARGIIPRGGFFRGCVYTIDPALGVLVPQLAIGAPLSDFKVISYVSEAPQDQTVINAFQASRILVSAVESDVESPVTCLARALGHSQRFGVLYLEIREMIFNVLEGNTRNEFNAIAYTFDDCFRLL